MIKKIPLKALGISLVSMCIGFGMGAKYGHRITWTTAEKTLNTDAVNGALNKPTTSNTTTNNVEIRNKKSDGVILDFKPETDQRAQTSIVKKDSCYTPKEWWGMSRKDRRELKPEPR